MIHKYPLFLLLFIFLNLLTCSQNVKEQNQENQILNPSIEKLHQAVKNLEKDAVMQHGTLAFSLKSVNHKQQILGHNELKTLNAASCMKAITTAAALDILGKDFSFKTDLEYDGILREGILEGNLFIKGYGDPTLGSQLINVPSLNASLTLWIQKIKESGIRQILGGIIADEEFYPPDPLPASWIWGDMGNYYGAGAGAINILDNTYKLWFRPTKFGETAQILKTEPFIPDIQFVNTVKTAEAGTGDRASIAGSPYDNLRFVSGTIPLGANFSIKGAIPDPGLLLAKQLTLVLKKAGISINQPASSTRLLKLQNKTFSGQRKLIYSHHSPNLKSIIKSTNLYSVNFYAEAILKRIGLKVEKEASSELGAKAIKEYWKSKGVAMTGFYMWDGSGLSLSNGITALQLTDILQACSKENYFNDFYLSLPLAGVSGTMQSVGLGTKAHNNMRAKTGYMTRIVAFAGYFRTQSNELMTFSLIANQYTCKYQEIKYKLEKIIAAMVEI